VTVDSSIAQNRTSTSSEPALFEDILSHPIQEGEFDQHVIVCGLSLCTIFFFFLVFLLTTYLPFSSGVAREAAQVYSS